MLLRISAVAILSLLSALAPQEALAQTPAATAVLDRGDTAWLLTATTLVLFMTLPGLALFYGGLVRSKNVLSVFMQCFAISGLASLLWLVAGYSLAFGQGGGANAWLGGLDNVLMAQIQTGTLKGSLPESLFSMFQMTFAIITPALVAGAYAERMRFAAVLLFSSLWLMVVYVPVAHWVWGGGWLSQMGTLDFAGGIVVHITAGVASLVVALVLGPRKGFPGTAMMPHNMTMVATGAGMLWVGWFGFNAGSALTANGDAAMALLATHIAAAAGTITWLIYEWVKFGKPTLLGSLTGMVAGLGTITAASGYVGPGGALVIGVVASLASFNAVQIIKRRLKIDDSLDVFPVHGVGGILGTLMAGFFASPALGIFSGKGFAPGITNVGAQMQAQALGVVAVAAYTALGTYVILKAVAVFTALRVSSDEETEGLDIASHEERGYDLH